MVPVCYARIVSSAIGLLALVGVILAYASSAAAEPAITPSSISFVNVLVGTTSATQTVFATNISKGATQFKRIATSAPFLATGDTCGGKLSSGQTCQIALACVPTAQGKAVGTLTVFLNRDQVQIVNLTSTGMNPPPPPIPAIFVTKSYPVYNISARLPHTRWEAWGTYRH
jgi:hypothetical protein